jgi:hypothetical protein
MLSLLPGPLRATLAAVLICLFAMARAAAAQAVDQPPPAPASPEIELNLINLPTTLSVKRHHSYFRLTHRFARDLRRGDFGSLLEDLFSLDNGAIIGLEYRFGVTSDLQAGLHRSMLSKTIQFFGRYDGWHQSDTVPVSISVLASIEGLDNFQQNYQPAVGATISRAVGRALVLYATPAFVGRTRAADFLRPTVYLAAEFTPRVSGHDPGRGAWGAAIEKKTRGHTLQVNITNSFGTTFGQLARGGSEHDIYLGFNVTRNF